jgi:putative membrane protein
VGADELKQMARKSAILASGALLLVVVLVVSGVRPYNRGTWLMEVLPVMVVLPVLWVTYRRFPLTTLLYTCIFAHALALMLGGAYTYARVPLGFELQEWLGLERNPYDRIGHFMQGFVPALAAREILLRGKFVSSGRMLAFLAICVVMAVSAAYELIEWGAALALGQGAEDFLGTQGDVWDTQADMFCALLGGIMALLLLSGLQDRQIRRFLELRNAPNRTGTT